MRDSKGISMISLIVTIICIILLSSMAIGTGTKYIRETRTQNRETFISVMSSAVARRQDDVNLNSVSYPYLGYHIDNSVVFERVFATKVAEPITFEDSTWYVVDTATARELGVKEPERYIETIDPAYTEEVTVALVDYRTAAVYLIEALPSEISSLPNAGSGPILGHTHRYVDPDDYPTCTLPKKCADCGFIDAEPTGHVYNALSGPRPASGDEENAHYNRTCAKCGMQGGYERHTFEYTHLVKNDKWYHKAICTVCGYSRKNVDGTDREDECNENVTLPTNESQKATSHVRSCRICLHTEQENHTIQYRSISESMHEKICAHVLCNYLILREFHVDTNPENEICDLCGTAIISYEYPQISVVEIEKTSPTPANEADKYIAKYGDTVTLKIVADKQIKNLKVSIGGHLLDSSIATITTTDNKTWQIVYNLNAARTIPDGEIAIEINCESLSGILLPSVVKTTTNNKNVIFDGTKPLFEYISKPDRINE